MLFLSHHIKFHMNLTTFKRSSALNDYMYYMHAQNDHYTMLVYCINGRRLQNLCPMCLHSSVQNSLCLSILNMCTVKPVLIGHHWDKEKVVS
jgi:hypothetical protein